jgi:MoxR-like ATPase
VSVREQIVDLETSVGQSVLGQGGVIRHLLIGLLADGHVLLESLPGLAKTRLVKSLAKHLDAKMSRIQFTPGPAAIGHYRCRNPAAD